MENGFAWNIYISGGVNAVDKFAWKSTPLIQVSESPSPKTEPAKA